MAGPTWKAEIGMRQCEKQALHPQRTAWQQFGIAAVLWKKKGDQCTRLKAVVGSQGITKLWWAHRASRFAGHHSLQACTCSRTEHHGTLVEHVSETGSVWTPFLVGSRLDLVGPTLPHEEMEMLLDRWVIGWASSINQSINPLQLGFVKCYCPP